MLESNRVKDSLVANLKWFENSGVMDPSDGRWGAGERVVLTDENKSLAKIYREFPFYTEHDGYSIMEHRRADCNFQVALLYWLSAGALNEPRYRMVCEKLLTYLFCRSGMRDLYLEKIPTGLWRWSMPQLQTTYWIDDNSWNGLICLLLSVWDKELGKKFPLEQAGLQVADAFTDFMPKALDDPKPWFHEPCWSGCVESPHWTALPAMTLACAFTLSHQQRYADVAMMCLDYLERGRARFTSSENAYLLLGEAMSAWLLDSDVLKARACSIGDHMCSIAADRGNFPSEWGETPAGKNLVDTIYTQNWATLGLQILAQKTKAKKYTDAFEKSVRLLMDIQDNSPAKHLHGCWRGLYDLDKSQWGGGDCFEGGANSIYTGWTNAPIAISLAYQLLNQSLASIGR
jgi:hypothetical protein